jgi:multiple sugar transport system substrate-binding protein
MKKYYRLPAIFLLVLLSFALTACSVKDLPLIGPYLSNVRTPNMGPVTLTMWGMWENPEVMNQLIAKYQEEHSNVTINYEDRSIMKPLADYKDRVFTRLDQEDGPDIVTVHASWVPQLSSKLSPLPSSLVDLATYQQSFYPAAITAAVKEGKPYAIPLYYDGLMMVYNKDHFAEIDQQQPPTAWEELRRLALELTIREGGSGKLLRAGAALGTADNNDHFSDMLGLMWAQSGVTLPGGLDSEPAADALTFYTNFSSKDGVWNNSFFEATTAFAHGEVSMIFVPTWRILEIEDMAPTLNYGVAPIPQILPETPVSWGTFWMEGVSANSKNAKAAWDFLVFLAQEDQQLALYDAASQYRSFGSAYALTSMGMELASHPVYGPLIGEAYTSTVNSAAGRSGNRDQVEVLAKAVNAVLLGMSSREALAQAKAELLK